MTGINAPLGRASERDIHVAGGPAAAFQARLALATELRGRVEEDERRDILLLLSEVVNNSVIHGKVDEDGWIGIDVALEGGCVRVEVTDSGTEGDPVAREPDYEDGGGFGLFLVETMASRWGVDRDQGLTVWFELDLNG